MEIGKTHTDTAPVARTSVPIRTQIVAAARANFAPGLLLQSVAVILVAAYYLWPAAHAAMESVAVFKARIGIWYPIISTAFFAGTLPLLMQRLQRGGRREGIKVWPFYLVYWAFIGVVVDWFYTLQAQIFGNGTDWWTITQKVVVDMFAFSPFLAMPAICVAFAWKDNGFDFNRTRRALGRQWYAERVFPMIVAAWIVWIPTVTLIYALPLALQFPVQNIVQCLWALILMFMTQDE